MFNYWIVLAVDQQSNVKGAKLVTLIVSSHFSAYPFVVNVIAISN